MSISNHLLTLPLTVLPLSAAAQNPVKGTYGYLYCHMSDKGEYTAYAVSRDGYHYEDILGGEAIFDSKEHARIEGGTRDAYITRAWNGKGYIMVTTDMCVAKSHKWDNYGKLAITPDYFWGPLVCLFSGMRIEECTSLEVKNIKTDDGVVLMHIKDAKTPTGIRFVPVHSFLIKMGFLDYVEEVRQLGHEGLFWYLSEGAMGKLTNHNGTKKNLSRHFSKYLEKVQVKEDDNCFHSLRHTTITRLVARRVNNSTIYKLSGHASDNSTHYDYLHDLPAKALQEAVEALDFHELLDFNSFDWKPSLQKVLAREARRAQAAESKRLREERLASRAKPAKQRQTKVLRQQQPSTHYQQGQSTGEETLQERTEQAQ